jgi:hypothetical protein
MSNSMQVIHESSFGSIAKCLGCESIQIEIGNMIIAGDYIDFIEVSEMILSIKDFPQGLDEVVLPILSSKTYMILRKNDLEKAKDLMNYSKIYFQTQDILENGKK